jgi:hypothetical protein
VINEYNVKIKNQKTNKKQKTNKNQNNNKMREKRQ